MHVPQLPAWRRTTQGELRWPVTVTLCAAASLQAFVPDKLQLVKPSWALPTAMGVLLIVLIGANPQRIDRQSRFMRSLGLVLGMLLTLANGWSVARLAIGITQGTMGRTAGQLLITGSIIWLTNVSVFALWYWEFDRGGPAARALNIGNKLPDFQFPQMVSPPEMVSPDWEPIFFDYLYLAFTNATAFSPTDVMPLSRWAKGGNDPPVGHLDRHAGAGSVPGGQHPAVRLTARRRRRRLATGATAGPGGRRPGGAPNQPLVRGTAPGTARKRPGGPRSARGRLPVMRVVSTGPDRASRPGWAARCR